MQRIKPKYIRIGGIILATLLIIVLIVGYIAYSKREAFLQKELVKAEAKAKKDYNLDIKIGSANFTGLSTVSFSDITIVPQDRIDRDEFFQVVFVRNVIPMPCHNIKRRMILKK